jgi:hypothetical protein
VALVEVDIVGAQSLQGCVELFANLGRRKAAIRVRHREEQLGCEDVRVARPAGERLAEEGLGSAPSIDVAVSMKLMPTSNALSRQARAASASMPRP